jgi:hypothetical protein
VLSHTIEHFGDNNSNLVEIGDTLDSKDVNAENEKAQNVTLGTNKNQAKQAKKVKKPKRTEMKPPVKRVKNVKCKSGSRAVVKSRRAKVKAWNKYQCQKLIEIMPITKTSYEKH